jgi:DNA-binding GntR family transcriptional regulator
MKKERVNSSQQAYGEIRGLIVKGQLAPGSWLIEADLSARLGLSRTPVRAALQTLQKEGYVMTSNGGAARSRIAVSPLTHEDARELYAIIGRLEGLAGRLTAQLPMDRRAKVVQDLAGFNAQLLKESKGKRPDPDVIFGCDLRFHRSIVEASAGPRLLDLYRTVQPQAERYWRLYASAIVDELRQSVREHLAIVDAIGRGEADEAEGGIQRNWQNGAERLAQVIGALGERGRW